MASKPVHFKKAVIIGVGLIGGSLALVLKKSGLADHVTGIGRTLENLISAKDLGIVDDYTQDIAGGIMGADFVFVAVPVLKIADAVRQALPHLKAPCVITDGGSVKKAVIDGIERLKLPDGVSFVPAHPIAGTENSGAAAAFPTLFQDRVCIITPTINTPGYALDAVKAVWEAAGSKVVTMDADVHDRILCAVSHLPHVIAYTLVNTVASAGANGQDILSFSAGGFRDFTRIASSSPEMWADICEMNGKNVIEMIGKFQERLETLKKLICAKDFNAVREDFERAKKVRDSLVKK